MNTDRIWQGVGKGNVLLHHAYGIAGERNEALRRLFAFLEKTLSYEVRANPDFSVNQYNTLTIDDSRRIKEMEGKKAFSGRKIIIIAFNAATADAQNALLKVLEEPSPDTHFFLIVPQSEVILPTLCSRLYLVSTDRTFSGPGEEHRDAEAFLKAGRKERLAMAKAIADAIAEGEKEKQVAIDLVGNLEVLCARGFLSAGASTELFKDLSLCRDYLKDPSASVKMLLEHVALVLPQAKM
ncbi:MAG TPA: hypothetical protein VJH94_03760 [Candidatus Paceibacterota bacterium]